MTVFRALRGASRAVLLPLAVLTCSVAPVSAQDSPVDSTVTSTTVTPTTVTPTTVTPTTRVASEAPVPGAGSPRVGPLDAGVGGGSHNGVWWLFALGGLQVAGLFVMTRRSRARLSTHDPAP